MLTVLLSSELIIIQVIHGSVRFKYRMTRYVQVTAGGILYAGCFDWVMVTKDGNYPRLVDSYPVLNLRKRAIL